MLKHSSFLLPFIKSNRYIPDQFLSSKCCSRTQTLFISGFQDIGTHGYTHLPKAPKMRNWQNSFSLIFCWQEPISWTHLDTRVAEKHNPLSHLQYKRVQVFCRMINHLWNELRVCLVVFTIIQVIRISLI